MTLFFESLYLLINRSFSLRIGRVRLRRGIVWGPRQPLAVGAEAAIAKRSFARPAGVTRTPPAQGSFLKPTARRRQKKRFNYFASAK